MTAQDRRTTELTRRRACVVLVYALGVAMGTADLSAKRKDDRLVLTNGDTVVGEVKKLARGELVFKTAYVLDSFTVDWRQVQELESQDAFQLDAKDGRHFTGTIARHADGRFTVVDASGALVTLDWSDIVGMLPVETSLWAQLQGNLDSGYSYTSGGGDIQFSASGSVAYVAYRYSISLTGSSSFTSASETSPSARNSLEMLNQITIAPQWFAVGLLAGLNSDQQQLHLRTTAGGGIGRWIIHTERTALTTFGGVAYTHEDYTIPPDPQDPNSQRTNNVEALLALGFSLYRFKTTDIRANFSTYPSLTSLGRVRLSFNPSLNLEIARNLYWSFTLYENFDSDPPVNANRNDFGVTNSFGWKF